MRIAITGGTGSLGGALLAALADRADVTRVVVVSRDEVKSGETTARWPRFGALRCALGDVRDRDRMAEVFLGCDAVIHAAALKQVTHSVYSPGEMMKTNVWGTVAVIEAAARAGVRRVLVVSSDKAVEACNLYGMTKAVAEGYAVQANAYTIPRFHLQSLGTGGAALGSTAVACVRYGNVLGSRGSVVPTWRRQIAAGAPLTLTDERMTRFVITLPEAAAFCLRALEDMEGGEIFVPRLPAAHLVDLLEAVRAATRGGGFCPVAVTGLRAGGEKFHEALLSREEPSRTYRVGDRMVVLPSFHSWRAAYARPPESAPVERPYGSDAPDRWLTPGNLIGMLSETVP